MKPILFSAEMVRAILDNRKTQTRRMVKPQPYEAGPVIPGAMQLLWDGCATSDLFARGTVHSLCPYGKPGDKLWVKETFTKEADGRVVYAADRAAVYSTSNKVRGDIFWLGSNYQPKKWTPSNLHAPLGQPNHTRNHRHPCGAVAGD